MKILIFTTVLFFICATPAQAQVVLSEVYPAPTSEESEWIELYNASEEPVDISGWKLFEHYANKNELTTFDEITIEAKSFFVFELSTSKLNNTEEKVTIENALNIETSALHYTNSQSQRSFSYLFSNEHTISETLESTVPTKGTINPLLPTQTPTPSPDLILSPTPSTVTTPSLENEIITMEQALIEQAQTTTDQVSSQEKTPQPNHQLELHKMISKKLVFPQIAKVEKEGLEKQLPKLSYLVRTKVSDEGVISAIIGGTLLLLTGLLL